MTDDGITFVHIARLDARDHPLSKLPAFAEFQRELKGRCVEQPDPRGPPSWVRGDAWTAAEKADDYLDVIHNGIRRQVLG